MCVARKAQAAQFAANVLRIIREIQVAPEATSLRLGAKSNVSHGQLIWTNLYVNYQSSGPNLTFRFAW
jgi:hypothetical protein